MQYFFYMVLCLFLIILQTTIMPYLSVFRQHYDLLLVFVLYLSLYRPVREGLPVLFLLGLVMDNLSGGPLGFFITTYFWIFIFAVWGTKFLHAGNRILILMVVAAGVLIENFIFLGYLAMQGEGPRISREIFDKMALQMLWAILTGPVLLVLIRASHRGFRDWSHEFFDRWNEYRGA